MRRGLSALLATASFQPLRRRDFALVWSAALVSNIGSWVQTIAVGILVTQLTGQARWTGLVAAAAFLPLGLLSPVGGALADRVDRRRLLLLTTGGEVVSASALALLSATGRATAGAVVAAVLGGGCMAALGFPAYQAILPDLVDRSEMLAASALSLAQYNLGRVIGPAVAGVLLAQGSYTWAFTVNAVSYGAVLVALLTLRLPPTRADPESGSLRRRIVAGARAAAGEPGCRTAILTVALAGFLLSPFIALIPAVALDRFGAGEAGTSLLVTAQGVGAVVGSLGVASVARRFGRRRMLVADLLLLPAGLVLYAVSPTLAIAAVVLVLVGALYVGILSGLGTVVQLRVPAGARARVLSLYMVALGSFYPLGSVVQGALADRFGLAQVTSVTAGLFAAIVLVVALSRRDIVLTLDDPLRRNPEPQSN